MGKTVWTEAKYGYRVKIDIERVLDQIIEALPGGVDDVSFGEDEIIISGTHIASCRHWTSPQTLESPAENEFELEYGIEDMDVKEIVKEALSQAVVTVEMDNLEEVEGDEW